MNVRVIGDFSFQFSILPKILPLSNYKGHYGCSMPASIPAVPDFHLGMHLLQRCWLCIPNHYYHDQCGAFN